MKLLFHLEMMYHLMKNLLENMLKHIIIMIECVKVYYYHLIYAILL